MTVYNAAVTVSTAAPEFGTGCGDFVASAGGYLYTPLTPSGPLDLGAGGDWTIEMWLNFGTQAAAGGVAHVVEIGGFAQSPHNYTLYITNGVGGAINFSAPGGLTSSTAYTANTWFALAVVNHGNAVQMYINGSAVGTLFTLLPSSNGGGNVTIGGQYSTSNDPFNGFVDELRISQVARYTSNYTPAGPFPSGYCNPNPVPIAGGTTLAAAEAAIVAAGFTVGGVSCVNGLPLGIVVGQTPAAGSQEPSGTPINLTQNCGPVALSTKGVSPALGKAIMMANVGNINPRIYEPGTDSTATEKLPRLPL